MEVDDVKVQRFVGGRRVEVLCLHEHEGSRGTLALSCLGRDGPASRSKPPRKAA